MHLEKKQLEYLHMKLFNHHQNLMNNHHQKHQYKELIHNFYYLVQIHF
jgi:hypothetical protein